MKLVLDLNKSSNHKSLSTCRSLNTCTVVVKVLTCIKEVLTFVVVLVIIDETCDVLAATARVFSVIILSCNGGGP